MAEALNHFADVEDLGAVGGKQRRRARVHAYPKYYRDGDPATGTLRETDCAIVPSDHPELSDWQMKKGPWSLYLRNDGAVCYKHLGRALVLELRALVVVRADRTFEVIATPDHSQQTISEDTVRWLDVFPGVEREVRAIPDQFRDVFTISQAARTQLGTWLLDHGYGGQLGSCYLAFAYKLTPRGFGDLADNFDFAMDADGEPFDQQTAKEHLGRFNFRVAGRVKQFIEGGAFTAIDAPLTEDGTQPSVPKLKRFFRRDGDWWFLEGARLDQLAALPPGRVRCNATATFREGVDAYAGTDWFRMLSGSVNAVYHATDEYAGQYGTTTQRHRGALRFDVSSIDPSATVTTATFNLTFTAEDSTTDYFFYLYKMLKDWNEPTGSHSPALANEPCWVYQYYNGTAWGAAGAGGEDVDRDTDVVASALVTSTAPTAFDFQSESIDSLVESWIQGTVANYGVMVAGQEDGTLQTKKWASPSHATESYRPLLTIVYELPAGGGGHPAIKRFGGVPYAALNRGVW